MASKEAGRDKLSGKTVVVFTRVLPPGVCGDTVGSLCTSDITPNVTL